MQISSMRISLQDMIKRVLVRTHLFWSKFIPAFYYPYRFVGGRIYLDIKESPMMLERALGRYEISKHHALQAFLERGKTLIDVGSNKGDFALVASKLVGREGHVIAFEPAPDNCMWIRKSIEKNGYENINLCQLALSDKNGTARLHIGEKSGWHSLIPGLPNRKENGIEVVTRTLDDYLREIGFRGSVDVLKMDVEGADMHVLRGARETLMNNKTIVLLLDLHPHLGVDTRQLCGYLKELGFSLFKEAPPYTDQITDCNDVYALVAKRV